MGLNKNSRQLLKYLIAYNSADGEVIPIAYIHKQFPGKQKTLENLEKEGYISINRERGSRSGVVLEEPGRYYNQFRWEQFKSFMIKSVIVPIILAIITAIITTLITIWLQGLR